MIKVWDQEVCSLCDLRFEPCGCSYDGHWRLTWSLTSGPVELVEVCTSWPGHLYQTKKKIHRCKSLKTHIYADQILDTHVFADFSTFLLRSIFTLGIIMNIH
jgi:hypothetical protein